MRRYGEELRLSATDIANHLACAHLTELDRAQSEGRVGPPEWSDPSIDLLRERGFRHERAYVAHLRSKGIRVAEDQVELGESSVERTVRLMRSGAGAILQAELGPGRWSGRADILLRVEESSGLGDWSYEVLDTKLAQETKAGTVLQLCLYTDLLAPLLGRTPTRMHVVKPGPDFPRESFRFDDYGAYYRLVRRRLEQTVAAPPAPTYPHPVAHCDICRWWKECDRRRHTDDHLSLVAGIGRMHVAELEGQEIRTLEQYAREPLALRRKPSRGRPETYARVHGQAKIQLSGREAGGLVHEHLPPEPGKGLALLPEPDPGDLYFDLESDPFAGDGGLEFLFGIALAGERGGPSYQATWALDAAGEKAALQRFMDLVMERWEKHPGMHIYHFSPYEPGAVKRMIGRHGTHEAELDRLLRAGRFVDLHAVTRQGLRVSVESYSLKSLEKCCGFTRAMDLREAGSALRRIARALELTPLSVEEEILPRDRETVESYNRDDCLATAALHAWLEERRAELVAGGRVVERPDATSGEASEAVEEREAKIQVVFDELTSGLPEDRGSWGPEERARWLIAHQLEYFQREDKCAWWEFFRIHDLEPEELMDERKAIAGLRFEREIGGGRSPVHRYRFPPQEVAFDPGDELYQVGGELARGTIGRVSALDLQHGILDLAKKSGASGVHPDAVMVNERVNPKPVDGALLELAHSAARGGVDGAGPYRAARDLLLRRLPRLHHPVSGSLRRAGEPVVDAAVRLARDLDQGVLPIQGPPGTGKTYTGARMIVALAAERKWIGVTAVSHKVIRNLLENVLKAAAESRSTIGVTHKVSQLSDEPAPGIEEVTDNAKAAARLGPGRVLGGTGWLWARDEMIQSLDYLFVDEAGQMSLAFVLAACRSARNVVLLGDPQQLEQPQRGAHPEGAEVAALVHVLSGRKTLADESGLFLDETWRLHPRIAAFTSELFYEGRLRSRPGLERQAIHGDTPFAGSGLFYVETEHQGNQASSPEEVEAIERIVASLLGGGVTWTNAEGEEKELTGPDILVVAPYNAQVAALSSRLRDVRVGTVDRFQGQEAPLVVYSMTSSSAEDAPRGMAFLYNPNRLNVATSRAKCASIIVATRRLLEPECGSPLEMLWANALCRYREMAVEVAV